MVRRPLQYGFSQDDISQEIMLYCKLNFNRFACFYTIQGMKFHMLPENRDKCSHLFFISFMIFVLYISLNFANKQVYFSTKQFFKLFQYILVYKTLRCSLNGVFSVSMLSTCSSLLSSLRVQVRTILETAGALDHDILEMCCDDKVILFPET